MRAYWNKVTKLLNPNAYLDIAKSIADESGISLSSDELLPTIQAANGSFRNLFHNLGRLARRQGLSEEVANDC